MYLITIIILDSPNRLLQSRQSISDLMVYRTISSQMKQRALELLDQGWDVGDIVDALAQVCCLVRA